MKTFLFVGSVVLGMTGAAQVMDGADRLAQRRVAPRRIPGRRGPMPVPQTVGGGGEGQVPMTPAEQADPTRCNAACDRHMNRCLERCRAANDSRTCTRACFTVEANCILQQCHTDASVIFPDAFAGSGPVLQNVPRPR